MEIIKPGKIRRVKLECPECGCEFACSPVEMVRRYGTVFAKCPQEGCGRSVEVPNGIPEYIEPANHTAIGTITMKTTAIAKAKDNRPETGRGG